MRISDWSSDLCSSDLLKGRGEVPLSRKPQAANTASSSTQASPRSPRREAMNMGRCAVSCRDLSDDVDEFTGDDNDPLDWEPFEEEGRSEERGGGKAGESTSKYRWGACRAKKRK